MTKAGSSGPRASLCLLSHRIDRTPALRYSLLPLPRRREDTVPMKTLNRILLLSGVMILLGCIHSLSQTQSDLNADSCGRHKKADAEMNEAYKRILNDYRSDTQFVEKLRAAQRAWLNFRDAYLESLYPERDALSAYGSVNPACRCLVLAELTSERTKALRQWVNGVEEGDVCAGSRKTRN